VFAANVRPIIKEIQASGVSSMRSIARALAARNSPARPSLFKDGPTLRTLR
jgi:hypothetical protein